MTDPLPPLDLSLRELKVDDWRSPPAPPGHLPMVIRVSEFFVESIPDLYPNLEELRFEMREVIISPGAIISVIERLPRLRSLSIGPTIPKTPELIQTISGKPFLKTVRIRHGDTSGLDSILRGISRSRFIEKIIISTRQQLVGEYLAPLYKMKSLKDFVYQSSRRHRPVDSRWWAPLPVEMLHVGNAMNLDWEDFETNVVLLRFNHQAVGRWTRLRRFNSPHSDS